MLVIYSAKTQSQNLSLADSGRRDQRDLWDKVWRDRHGRVVILRRPNVWLIAWFVLTCISLLASSRSVANTFWWVSFAALAVWALLEIFRGANYFRRALGVVVLLIVVGGALGVGL